MTVARMRREVSGLEFAGWVGLENLRNDERKREEAKARRGGRRRR